MLDIIYLEHQAKWLKMQSFFFAGGFGKLKVVKILYHFKFQYCASVFVHSFRVNDLLLLAMKNKKITLQLHLKKS